MKSPALALTFCLVLAGCQSLPDHSYAESRDMAEIRQVVESFRTSLINKDKASDMSLFFSDKPEDIGWQFVSEDTRLDHTEGGWKIFSVVYTIRDQWSAGDG